MKSKTRQQIKLLVETSTRKELCADSFEALGDHRGAAKKRKEAKMIGEIIVTLAAVDLVGIKKIRALPDLIEKSTAMLKAWWKYKSSYADICQAARQLQILLKSIK